MKRKSKYICPTCKQDMRAKPHPGLGGKDCPQCGQGIKWRLAQRVEKHAKREAKKAEAPNDRKYSAERDAALARAEKAEAQRDVYTGLYLFANQQHEQQETELQRYKEIMPCGHARMLEILNDGQMPECSVCWLERVEKDNSTLTARLAELQARDFGDVALASARKQRDDAYAELTQLRARLEACRDTFNALDEFIGVLERAHIEAGWIQVAPQFVAKMRSALAALASGAESEVTK